MQVQAQNSPDLPSALCIAQRMEAVLQTMHSKASKPVRVVMEDHAGTAVTEEGRDPLVEQLAKAIQQLDQLLPQANAKGSEPGSQR